MELPVRHVAQQAVELLRNALCSTSVREEMVLKGEELLAEALSEEFSSDTAINDDDGINITKAAFTAKAAEDATMMGMPLGGEEGALDTIIGMLQQMFHGDGDEDEGPGMAGMVWGFIEPCRTAFKTTRRKLKAKVRPPARPCPRMMYGHSTPRLVPPSAPTGAGAHLPPLLFAPVR